MWRVPDSMYSGDRHPTRESARCHLYRSPAWQLPINHPSIHAVVIRSCKVVPAVRRRASGCTCGCRRVGTLCMNGSFDIRTRQGGCGRILRKFDYVTMASENFCGDLIMPADPSSSLLRRIPAPHSTLCTIPHF
eukprot:6738558-Prymnesium_polylepis.1